MAICEKDLNNLIIDIEHHKADELINFYPENILPILYELRELRKIDITKPPKFIGGCYRGGNGPKNPKPPKDSGSGKIKGK